MKALLINPESSTIEEIEIQGREDIIAVIGYDTIIADEIGPDGDQLYFDEECFLRGTPGRFQIDNVIPVSGKGVIAGATDDHGNIKDVVNSMESIENRIKYL